MPPLPDYKYDVFLSCATQDNEPDQYQRQLVSGILDTLRANAAADGSAYKFFFQETPPRDRDQWEAIARPAISQSRILVVFTSRKYFETMSCMWEWESFQSACEQRGEQSEERGNHPQIQIVSLDPVTATSPYSNAGHSDWMQQVQDHTPFALKPQARVDTETLRHHVADLDALITKRLLAVNEKTLMHRSDNLSFDDAVDAHKRVIDLAQRLVRNQPDDMVAQSAHVAALLSLSELQEQHNPAEALSTARRAHDAVDTIAVQIPQWPNPSLPGRVLANLADLESPHDKDKSLSLREEAVASGELAWQATPQDMAVAEVVASDLETLAAGQGDTDPQKAYDNLHKASHLRRAIANQHPHEFANLLQLLQIAGRAAEIGTSPQVESSNTTIPAVPHDGPATAATLTLQVSKLLHEASQRLRHNPHQGGELLTAAAHEAEQLMALATCDPSQDVTDCPDAAPGADRVSTPRPLRKSQYAALHLTACLWAIRVALHSDKPVASKTFVATTSRMFLVHETNTNNEDGSCDGHHLVADFLETAARAAAELLPVESADALILAAMCWDSDADTFGSQESMLHKSTSLFQAAELRLHAQTPDSTATVIATLESAVDVVLCMPNPANAHATDQIVESLTRTMRECSYSDSQLELIAAYRDDLVNRDQTMSQTQRDATSDTLMVTAIRLTTVLAEASASSQMWNSHSELTTGRVLNDCLLSRARPAKHADRIATGEKLQEDLAELGARLTPRPKSRSSQAWLSSGFATP